MVSTPSEFTRSKQHKGVALHAYHPESQRFITLPLANPVEARQHYKKALECVDAADYISEGLESAEAVSYTQRQPTGRSLGYSGFKTTKTPDEVALADTFAALYNRVQNSNSRIIGVKGYSLEVLRGRLLVTYNVSNTVGEDASDFNRYVIPWSAIAANMHNVISINPFTQEVMLWHEGVSDAEVVSLADWEEFDHLIQGDAPGVKAELEEDELDRLTRRKRRGDRLTDAEFKLMQQLRQKRAWEDSKLYAKTKNNPLIQKLAVPNKAVIDGEVVNYDRGILDHPEAWHTHILDYILSLDAGDWFHIDDIDRIIRKANIKLGRSDRTQFMSMTAYLLKLCNAGMISIRDIVGLDVYTSLKSSSTVPLVSVDSFTVLGGFKPVQGDLFDLLPESA